MGLLGKIIGLGATVGAVFAAKKIADKYDDNKTAGENTDNIVDDVKKAAQEFADDAAVYAKDLAQKAKQVANESGIDTEKVAQTVKDAANKAATAGKEAVEKAVDPETLEKVKTKAKEIIKTTKDAVTEFATGDNECDVDEAVEEIKDDFADVAENVTEVAATFAEDAKETVEDAKEYINEVKEIVVDTADSDL